MQARVLAGIDEAGLGPMLGPLAMGVCALRFQTPISKEIGQDLWELLGEAVSLSPDRGAGRLMVADSKLVYQRNPRGWQRLEATALAFLQQRGGERTRFADFFVQEQAALDAPWYGELPRRLPVQLAEEDLVDHRERLARSLAACGIDVAWAGLRLLSARELNASFRRTNSKAATTWQATVGLLAELVERFGDLGVYAIVDRQGGRKRYGDLLARDFPGYQVLAQSESAERSDYAVLGSTRKLWVSFRVGAESESLPTAAASCFAKYGREISMEAFNRYFATRQAGLRPTAGYVTDARRWLQEAQEALSEPAWGSTDLIRER